MPLKLSRKAWIFISILLLIGVIGIVTFIIQLSYKYRNYVRAHYKEWVHKASKGLYELDVEEININIFSRNVTIKGIHLYPNEKELDNLWHKGLAPGAVTQTHIPKVTLNGIMWEDLLLNNEINVGDLIVHSPKIRLRLVKNDTTAHNHNNIEENSRDTIGNIYFLQRDIKVLSARNIEIRDPLIQYSRYHAQEEDPYILSNGGRIAVQDWRYEPGQVKDTTLLFYAQRGIVFLKSLAYYKPGSNYMYALDSLLFNPGTFSADLRRFRMFNIYSEEGWRKKFPIQKSRYHIYVPRAYLREVQWQQFLYNDRLIADTVEVHQPEINIWVDRRMAKDTADKTRNFPTTLLNRATLPFYLEMLQLFDGKVFYHERAKNTERSATVAFTDIDADIRPITNEQHRYPNDSVIICKGTAAFLNRGRMNTEVVFDNRKGRTDFSILFGLKNISQTEISPISTNLALIEMKSMELINSQFSGKGNAHELSLCGFLQYDNLSIALKKLDTTDQSITAKPVLSFIANNLALFPSNPMPGKSLRLVNVYRDNEDKLSMITLLWKTLLRATLHTIMKEEDYIELVRNRDQRVQQKLDRKEDRKQRKQARRARKNARK